MKFKGKEIKILYVKFKHHNYCIKEIHISDRKSRIKEQAGTDRNRQDYTSDIENYCIIKKFKYQIGNQEAKENPTEKNEV